MISSIGVDAAALYREQNCRTDCWPQNGIFEALSRSFLSAVQLSIVLDKDHISKVIESYTFSFKYIDTASIEAPGKRLQGMMISGSHGRPVTINNARAGLETISRYLIQLTQYLPDLPGKSCK